MSRGGWYESWGKRTVDLAVSAAALTLLSPLLGLVAIAVRLVLGKPVLFRQQRPGKGGRPFQIVKFRSMTEIREGEDPLQTDGRRLTAPGRVLRGLSLDELPTLWNVFKGEMSLVGPRPLLMEYLGRYTAEQARRHEVKPGITGWAQVNGRNAVSWEEKFKLDVWYVDHVNLGLDARIMVLTLWKVLRREGITASGHATMPPFTGSREGGVVSGSERQ